MQMEPGGVRRTGEAAHSQLAAVAAGHRPLQQRGRELPSDDHDQGHRSLHRTRPMGAALHLPQHVPDQRPMVPLR